jgi:hypothetical protein
MKDSNSFVESGKVNSDRRRRGTESGVCNLRTDGSYCRTKVCSRCLIAKAGSHRAAHVLKCALDGIVQTAVPDIVAPERNYRANTITPHQGDDRFCFASVVGAQTKDVIAGDRQRYAVLPDWITRMLCASA